MRAVSVPALGLAVVSVNRDPLLGRLRHRQFEIDKLDTRTGFEIASGWPWAMPHTRTDLGWCPSTPGSFRRLAAVNEASCSPSPTLGVTHAAWEYEIYHLGSLRSPEETQRIAALGLAGWELAAVDSGALYFKRERPDDQAPAGSPVLTGAASAAD